MIIEKLRTAFYKRTCNKSCKYFQSHEMVFNEQNLYKTNYIDFHIYISQSLEQNID